MDTIALPFANYQPEDLERLRAIYPDLTHSFEVKEDGHTFENLDLGLDTPSRHSIGYDPLMRRVYEGKAVTDDDLHQALTEWFQDGEFGGLSGRANVSRVPDAETERKHIADAGDFMGKHLQRVFDEYKNPPATLYRWRPWALWQRSLRPDAIEAWRDFYVMPDGEVRIANAVSAPWWVGLFPRSWRIARGRAPRGYYPGS